MHDGRNDAIDPANVPSRTALSGVLVGLLHSTARLLQDLVLGDLLPRHLPTAMLDQYPVGRPIAGVSSPRPTDPQPPPSMAPA
jgi:hypothetical protein